MKVFGPVFIHPVVKYLVFSSFICRPISLAVLSSDKKASLNAFLDLATISMSSAYANSWTDL